MRVSRPSILLQSGALDAVYLATKRIRRMSRKMRGFTDGDEGMVVVGGRIEAKGGRAHDRRIRLYANLLA